MVVKIFTNDDRPENRQALELGKRLENEGYAVEYFDAEEEKTTSVLEVYDVYAYPSFLITKEDGVLLEQWIGMIPLEGDIKIRLSQ